MRRTLLYVTAVMVVCIACKKDKIGTVPSLKLKSINSKNIPVNADMAIEFEFTDKQGDIVNDTLLFIKVRNNQNQVATLRDTLSLIIPDFPERQKGLINLSLEYNNYLISAQSPPGPPNAKESDSLTMKFVLKDNASNHSDTLIINDIVIQRN